MSEETCEDRTVKAIDQKRMARSILNRAIRAGRVTKPTACTWCGATGRIEGHHGNYDMPLVVDWLCPGCHGIADRIDRERARGLLEWTSTMGRRSDD